MNEGVESTYIGLPDNRPQAEFDRVMDRKRAFYRPSQKLNDVRSGISRCFEKKNNEKFDGMWLLVLAPLTGPRRSAWAEIVPDLIELAEPLPFAQVHVFCEAGDRPFGFRVK